MQQWVIDQMVRELAYSKWEQAGRPDDMDIEYWVEAEKEVLENLQSPPESN